MKIVFRDFDEFADAINGITGQFIPTARSEADWWVQPAPLSRVGLQQVQIGGAATYAGDGAERALTLGVPLTQPRRIRIDGDLLEENSFLLVKEGQPFTFAAKRPTFWVGVVVPTEHPALSRELLDSLSASFGGKSCAHPQTQLCHMQAMRRLVWRLFATDGSIRLDNAAAILAAEEEIFAVASCVLETSSHSNQRNLGRPRFSRDLVIEKALTLIEESGGQPLQVHDLCRATCVSERTLRNVFQEYFGVAPMRLLKVRQLHEIRAALLSVESDGTTVGSIASRFGIWDFSQFARAYKALYGEAPSETLHRPAVGRQHKKRMDATWIRYASRKFSDSLRT